MAIAPLGGALPSPAPLPSLPDLGDGPAATPGFGEALGRGLQQVSALEQGADALVQDVATGGDTQIHEVMAATTQAGLATDLLVQVRDRALEAYHEVMRLQL